MADTLVDLTSHIIQHLVDHVVVVVVYDDVANGNLVLLLMLHRTIGQLIRGRMDLNGGDHLIITNAYPP